MKTEDAPLFEEFLETEVKRLSKQLAPPPPPKVLKDFLKAHFWRQSIKVSVFFHISIFLIMLFVALIGRFWVSDAEREAEKKAALFKSAIRVDVVDLPRAKIEELSKIDLSEPIATQEIVNAKEKPSRHQKESDEADEENKSASQMHLSKEKEIPKVRMVKKAPLSGDRHRLEDLRRSLRAETRRKEIAEKFGVHPQGRQALAGNIASEGFSTSGDVAKDIDTYTGQIFSQIQKNWTVPSWMKNSSLEAEVRVKIAPDGRILSKEFIKKSGNAEFDQEVARAIDFSNPLPAPPAAIKRKVMEEGVVCGF